jgi:hypothetical protein
MQRLTSFSTKRCWFCASLSSLKPHIYRISKHQQPFPDREVKTHIQGCCCVQRTQEHSFIACLVRALFPVLVPWRMVPWERLPSFSECRLPARHPDSNSPAEAKPSWSNHAPITWNKTQDSSRVCRQKDRRKWRVSENETKHHFLGGNEPIRYVHCHLGLFQVAIHRRIHTDNGSLDDCPVL